ncbi:MAG: Nif3-like dinuclear metal center hexameric protein [Firmicutes bacterium]|nr:Nif3-like dinuclear metal center hexameric protein [Bacillota bacterium]
MQLKVQTLINILEKLAPKHLALEWDKIGLQLGNLQGIVTKIYVTLDVSEEALDEAIAMGADFIVTHHPFIFKPLTAIRTDQQKGRLIQRALEADIAIYAAHTNLDLANGGVNDALAQKLGIIETAILQPAGHFPLEKIVVYVPTEYVDNVRNAMSAAGAGWIGNYSHCSFGTKGIGTFLPQEGTTPFVGEQGKLEKVEEVRLETVVPANLRKQVIRAMVQAHPYEEVAYDLYALLNEGQQYGLGRIGFLEQPCSLADFCLEVKKRLDISFVRVTGDLSKIIKKVSVCGGAGSDLIHAAAFAGADVLVTGDLKYHEAQDADALGLSIIDAGHDATEKVIVPVLCNYLEQQLAEAGYEVEIAASTIKTTPWRII